MCRYKRKVSLLAYLFLLFLPLLTWSQTPPAWDQRDYYLLFNLDAYRNISLTDTDDPAKRYLQTYKIALSHIIFESPSTDIVQQNIEQATLLIQNASIAEELKLYYQADLLMLSAYLELKKGNELKFIWMMNDTYRLSNRLINDYQDFLPGNKIAGVINIMVAAVPEQYQWILNLLGYNGSTTRGLSLLEEINKSKSPLRYESLILTLMMKRYLNISDPENSSDQLESTIEENPEMSLMRFIAALTYIKQHNSRMARAHLSELDHVDSPYISYLLGETSLHSGNHQESIRHFTNFIQKSSGSNLKKDAYTKIYINHYILGNKILADKYYDQARNSGNTYSEADKNANKILNDPDKAHPLIFKIRYATDGGYDKMALSLLKEVSMIELNEKDKIELTYRVARLYHLSGDEKEAIKAYKKTIDNYDGRYFAPNSALQLGYIYQQKNELNKATAYFNRVLEYKNYTYENSINSKAQRALKNIEQ